MERRHNESLEAYRKRRSQQQAELRPGRRKFYNGGGTYVRDRVNEKKAAGGFPKTEMVPVKGTNQKVLVTTFTRYPNEQTMKNNQKQVFSER